MRAEGFVEAMPYSEFDVVFGMLAYTDRLEPAEKTAILERRAAHLRSSSPKHGRERRRRGLGRARPAHARVRQDRPRHTRGTQWLEEVLAEVERDGWTPMRRGTAVEAAGGASS